MVEVLEVVASNEDDGLLLDCFDDDEDAVSMLSFVVEPMSFKDTLMVKNDGER